MATSRSCSAIPCATARAARKRSALLFCLLIDPPFGNSDQVGCPPTFRIVGHDGRPVSTS
ncbi:MAG: hypothetical protein ACK56F_04615 [bacterium]